MKKRLNTEAIENELKGGSAFFPDYQKPAERAETGPGADEQPGDKRDTSPTGAGRTSPLAPVRKSQEVEKHAPDTMTPRHHDTTVSRHHETMTPLQDDVVLEGVRKSVKQIGKEAATHRFTQDEKGKLTDIEYTYKRRGIKTSENEITRIAINYFIEEYRINGEQSLLAKILKKLNS